MVEWFEDLTLGMKFKSGKLKVTEEDIKRFAAEFDPQPMHLDDAAAQRRCSRDWRHQDGTQPPWR
jgi:acyl dehydratase